MHTDIYEFGHMAKLIAENIPFRFVNLDHGETFETCIKAINANFTNYDRQINKSFEDNVRETKEMVKMQQGFQ